MRKLISSMHTTLDGFVAGPNGEMDWINVDAELFDLTNQLIEAADTALYGRVTYEMMQAYWPTAAEKPAATKHDIEHSSWYNKTPKIVLSKTLNEAELNHTKVISDNLAENILKLKQTEGKNIILFGSPSAVHALTALGLIDEFWLFQNPVILGQGIPLFKDVSERIQLKLLETKVYSIGVVGLHYAKL